MRRAQRLTTPDGFSWNLKFELSFRKYVEKIQVSLKTYRHNGYFTWRRFHILTASRWILLRMKNVSDKICRQNQNTHFMFNTFPRNRAVYEIKSKKYGGAKKGSKCQYDACALHSGWVRLHACKHTPTPSQPTYTHSCARMRALTHSNMWYNAALRRVPLLQWSRERASVLRYTCTSCLFSAQSSRVALPSGVRTRESWVRNALKVCICMYIRVLLTPLLTCKGRSLVTPRSRIQCLRIPISEVTFELVHISGTYQNVAMPREKTAVQAGPFVLHTIPVYLCHTTRIEPNWAVWSRFE